MIVLCDKKITSTCCVYSSDQSIVPSNTIPVFQAIAGDWDEIYPDYTIVPRARAQLFHDKFHDHNSLAAEAGIYYACCHPEPNWKTLSLHLYKAGETQAVEMAKHHIQSVAGEIHNGIVVFLQQICL